jgi:hypothetical protein
MILTTPGPHLGNKASRLGTYNEERLFLMRSMRADNWSLRRIGNAFGICVACVKTTLEAAERAEWRMRGSI